MPTGDQQIAKLSEMTRKFPEEAEYRETESWSMTAWIWGWEQELTAKGHKGTFGMMQVF